MSHHKDFEVPVFNVPLAETVELFNNAGPKFGSFSEVNTDIPNLIEKWQQALHSVLRGLAINRRSARTGKISGATKDLDASIEITNALAATGIDLEDHYRHISSALHVMARLGDPKKPKVTREQIDQFQTLLHSLDNSYKPQPIAP